MKKKQNKGKSCYVYLLLLKNVIKEIVKIET